MIPAHNEEALLPGAVASIRRSFDELGVTRFEVIVVDDASTDCTKSVARDLEVVLADSGKRNIGATRNVGAGLARGQWIIFLDADTRITTELAAAFLRATRETGVVGGGSVLRWSEPVRAFGGGGIEIWNCISRMMKLPAGGFFFVEATAFRKVGGFDEQYFASEELHLGRQLKKLGRLRILPTPALTSPRKLERYSGWELASLVGRIAMSPRRVTRDRDSLDLWYKRR